MVLTIGFGKRAVNNKLGYVLRNTKRGYNSLSLGLMYPFVSAYFFDLQA
jgi:hypothetical protein